MKLANAAAEFVARPAVMPVMPLMALRPASMGPRNRGLDALRMIWVLACLVVSLPVFVVASVGLAAALYVRGMRALLSLLLPAPVLLPGRHHSGAI